jgi:hypothetical protein
VRGHDLLVQERPAAPLDHAARGVDLVGAVDGDVQHGHVGEGDQRDAGGLGQPLGLARAGQAAYGEARAHALTQQAHHVGGGAARAQAHHHAALDEGQAALGSVDLRGGVAGVLLVHGPSDKLPSGHRRSRRKGGVFRGRC